MGEDGGGHGPGLRDVGLRRLVVRREHLVGLGQREVELTGAERGLGPPGRQPQRGRSRGDGGGVELARTGKAGAQRLVGRGGEDARHPGPGRARAQQPACRGEDVAAAVELAFGERALGLQARRGRRALQHGRRHQRDRRAVRGEEAFRAGGLHELVERPVVDGDVGPQQRHEEIGLQRRADRARPEEVADAVRKAVDGVAQLGQQASGRAGRVPPPSRGVGAADLDERGEHAVDERGQAAGLGEDEVDERVRRPRGPLAEQARRPRQDPRPVQGAEDDRRPARRQRRAEGRHAVRTRPRAMGDDEHADRALGQRGQPGEGGGREPVRVVDEQRGPRRVGGAPRVGVGQPPLHDEARRPRTSARTSSSTVLPVPAGPTTSTRPSRSGAATASRTNLRATDDPASAASGAGGACAVITTLQ